MRSSPPWLSEAQYHLGCGPKRVQFTVCGISEHRHETGQTPASTRLQQGSPGSGYLNEIDPPITGLRDPLCETPPFKIIDQSRHGRCSYLLGAGERAHGLRAAEDEHRQRRQLRRSQTRSRILASHKPQEPDGGAMDHVRDLRPFVLTGLCRRGLRLRLRLRRQPRQSLRAQRCTRPRSANPLPSGSKKLRSFRSCVSVR